MYSIIDIEGNGGGFREECIIDIAIYRYDGQKVVDQFISLVDPEAEITSFVQKLTGITPKMVARAPKFHEIAKRVLEITEGTTLVGHNIEFDYRMLRQSFRRLGYRFEIDTLDTIPLAKKLIPDLPSYSLGKLVKSLGIPLTEAHRAGGDARATLDLFKLLVTKDTDNEIIQKHHEETNAKTYINKIKKLTQDLPSKTGILYYQDAQGEILLTEYAEDINRSARHFFSSKAKRLQEAQNKTEQIHFDLTPNALLAQLMLHSRGVQRVEKYPFILVHRGRKYTIERKTIEKKSQGLLHFKSYTQGLKALTFLIESEKYKDPQDLINYLALENRTELWISEGRVLGEKAFYIIDSGTIKGYGFYELHTQIQDLKKIDRLTIPVHSGKKDFSNEMKLTLLKSTVKIHPLPLK